MTREEWRMRAIEHGTELRKVKEQLEIAIATLELYALEKMYLRDNKSGIVFELENILTPAVPQYPPCDWRIQNFAEMLDLLAD